MNIMRNSIFKFKYGLLKRLVQDGFQGFCTLEPHKTVELCLTYYEEEAKYLYSTGFERDKIVLGGDHLGPLVWADSTEKEAMEKAGELVRQFIKAGFKKIHLDTSMRLADDDSHCPLSDEVIARRGVILYQACEEAYQELKKDNQEEARPVFVIGSEVPIPGGAREAEDSIAVTKPEDFARTVEIYRKTFEEYGILDAFENIIAVVVQPGVEFGDSEIHHYHHEKAITLCEELQRQEGLVLEGHSTDYQTPQNLKAMVEDGIAILKVGPALTFALREGIVSLSMIEKEVIEEGKRADFMRVLEKTILKEPANWNKHYHGGESELKLARKYSFSDRSRYYMNAPEVQEAIENLFENLDGTEIPLNLLHQYMPLQYIKVRDGRLPNKAAALAKDAVVTLIEDYNYAVKLNYMVANVFIK